MRIGQLKEIQISLKDTDLLEMEGGFNSYKLPLRKLFEYIKTKLNLAQVAFTGDYYHLKNIPPVRVASKSNLGLVRIGDNLLISPDGVLSAIPFSGWRNPDWEEEDETLASYIENKPDLSLFATRIYVDVKDKEILDESKGYTNKEVEVTLDVLRNYTDTSAENTLNSAKTYTDSRQQSTLDSANQYTDKAVGGIVDQAKEYTDEREVAIRETISASQETSKEYTDTKVSSTLEESKEYTDSQISASEGREDTKFATVNERIDGIENTLDEGYVLSVDGKSGAVDLSGSYEQKRKNNLEATTDPTPNDDSSQGYEILSKWINQSTGEMWVCLQDTVGEANWQHHTLTIDELGSAATADVGTASNQLPTNATVDSKISTGMDTKVDKVAGKQLSDENFTAEEKSKLAEAITSDDPRLVDSREWIAPTVTQEEAEEGTSQERRAWTAERDRQATEAWWNGGGDKEKLDGIEDGATKNSTDAELRDRTTHTGEQPITSVTGLQEALDGKADSGDIPDVSGFATKQEVEALDQSLAPVAKSGLYSSLVGTPSLGSASEKDVTDFATATQGSKADTAVQPEALTSYALKTEVPQTADDLPAGTLNKYITQEEKEKLATMEGSHYKGLFVSLTELIESVQDPVAGDYADVDAGSGSPISRYIWDPSDNEWVEQTGDGEPLSNAQIKERYEANPNTNAFEDDEKAKLATVQVGATKNSTDVELRDRSTHTGVQPISSVEGLQESLGGKLNVNGVNPTLQSVSNLNLLLKSGEDTSNVIKATVGDEESWHIGKDSADSDNVSFRNSKLGTSISLTDLGVVTDKNFFVNGNQVYHQGNLDTDGFVKTTGAQTIEGSKIFTASPQVPDDPSFDGAAVNKSWVDGQLYGTGTNTVLIGKSSTSSGHRSITIGSFSTNSKTDSVIIGNNSKVGDYGISIGSGASGSNSSIAIGGGTDSVGEFGVAIGRFSKSNFDYSVALGGRSNSSKPSQVSVAELDPDTHLSETPRLLSGVATPIVEQDAANRGYVDSSLYGEGVNSISVGVGTSSIGLDGISIGAYSSSSQSRSIAIGSNSKSSGSYGIVIGYSSEIDGEGGVSIGHLSKSTGSNSTSIGTRASAEAPASIALGSSSKSSDQGSLAIGVRTTASGTDSIAIGSQSVSSTRENIAIGNRATASTLYSIAIGSKAVASHTYSIALGNDSTTARSRQVSIAELNPSNNLSDYPRSLSGVADPVVAQDAANKAYVDSSLEGKLSTTGSGDVGSTFSWDTIGAGLEMKNPTSPIVTSISPGTFGITGDDSYVALSFGGISTIGKDALTVYGAPLRYALNVEASDEKDLVNKGYVDNLVGDIVSTLNAIIGE